MNYDPYIGAVRWTLVSGGKGVMNYDPYILARLETLENGKGSIIEIVGSILRCTGHNSLHPVPTHECPIYDNRETHI